MINTPEVDLITKKKKNILFINYNYLLKLTTLNPNENREMFKIPISKVTKNPLKYAGIIKKKPHMSVKL